MLTLPQRQTILLIWACIKAQTISCPNLFRVIYVITTGINLVCVMTGNDKLIL